MYRHVKPNAKVFPGRDTIVVCIILLMLSCGAGAEPEIRSMILAGSWYPRDPAELRALVTQYLQSAVAVPDSSLDALIVPHAGYRYSGRTAGEGYASIPFWRVDRVIILAPSHHRSYRGISAAPFEGYETPLGIVPVDPVTRELPQKHSLISEIPEAHSREHSIEIQLPFLQTTLSDFTIVPLLIGNITAEQRLSLAAVLKGYIDERTLLLVSSDFTHYGNRFGYTPFGASNVSDLRQKLLELDSKAADIICESNAKEFAHFLARTKDTICGRNAIGLLLDILPEDSRGMVIDYSTSLDVSPDPASSVSYYAIGFSDHGEEQVHGREAQMFFLTDQDKKALVTLARDAVIARLEKRPQPDTKSLAKGLSDVVKEHSGVFVTLTMDGRLRGCIGYIEGFKPMIEAVMDNAVSAAFRDPRFPPVSKSEFSDLAFKVSILTPLEPVADMSEIEVGRHGLVLSAEGHRGVFLPEVPVEQGWSRTVYLEQLGRKAGLDGQAWKRAELQSFESIVFGDEMLEDQ